MSQNYITLKVVLQVPSEQDHTWAQNKHLQGEEISSQANRQTESPLPFPCAPNNRPPLLSVQETILCNPLLSWDGVRVQMSFIIPRCVQKNNHQSLTAQTQHPALAVSPQEPFHQYWLLLNSNYLAQDTNKNFLSIVNSGILRERCYLLFSDRLPKRQHMQKSYLLKTTEEM